MFWACEYLEAGFPVCVAPTTSFLPAQWITGANISNIIYELSTSLLYAYSNDGGVIMTTAVVSEISPILKIFPGNR